MSNQPPLYWNRTPFPKDVVGRYIVECDERNGRKREIHIAKVVKIASGHMTLVGNMFGFDMPPIIGWVELPTFEEKLGDYPSAE